MDVCDSTAPFDLTAKVAETAPVGNLGIVKQFATETLLDWFSNKEIKYVRAICTSAAALDALVILARAK